MIPKWREWCMSGMAKRQDLKTWGWWKAKLLKHFLPLGMLLGLIVGLAFPWLGATISNWQAGDYRIIPTVHVCTIFVISGLTLKTDDAVAALKQPLGLVYGLLSILVITPLFGFAAIRIPFDNPAFATGLTIFCLVPTTLTSGVALVTAAYGNAALALMLTVASNMLGIVTVPFLLKIVVDGPDASLDAVELLLNLVLTILVPLTVGKVVQEVVPRMKPFVKKHKAILSLISNGSLLLIVWQSISRAQEDLVDTPFEQIVYLLLCGVGLHLVYLAINYAGGKLIRLEYREFKAVFIMGSQKTLPVAITLISFLDRNVFGAHGLLTIPCIVGHVTQLFIDAAIVSRMASEVEERLAAEAHETDVENQAKGASDPSDSLSSAPPSAIELANAPSDIEVQLDVRSASSPQNQGDTSASSLRKLGDSTLSQVAAPATEAYLLKA